MPGWISRLTRRVSVPGTMRATIATMLPPHTTASTGCLVVRGVVHDDVAVAAACPGMVFELSTTAVEFELMGGCAPVWAARPDAAP